MDITTEPPEYADDDDEKGGGRGKGKDDKGKKGAKDKDDEAAMKEEDSAVRPDRIVAYVVPIPWHSTEQAAHVQHEKSRNADQRITNPSVSTPPHQARNRKLIRSIVRSSEVRGRSTKEMLRASRRQTRVQIKTKNAAVQALTGRPMLKVERVFKGIDLENKYGDKYGGNPYLTRRRGGGGGGGGGGDGDESVVDILSLSDTIATHNDNHTIDTSMLIGGHLDANGYASRARTSLGGAGGRKTRGGRATGRRRSCIMNVEC